MDKRKPTKRRSSKKSPQRRREAAINKVLTSPALNGGFDTLMIKVERIEVSAEDTARKVADVHQAIYDPDDGLFARIRENESTSRERAVELDAWKLGVDKERTAIVQEDKVLLKRVDDHDDQLRDLVVWKTRMSGAYKWVFVTLAAGSFGVIFKLLYDLLKHVSFN